MSKISTHILDTMRGKPGANIPVSLSLWNKKEWLPLRQSTTDADGRVASLLPADTVLEMGLYRLEFDVQNYFLGSKTQAFYQHIPVQFYISDPQGSYHIPLLLSPFGYSTYRGS